MKNRLFLLLAIIMMMFGTQSVSAVELGAGLAEPEMIVIPSSEITESVGRETATQSEQVVNSEWDKYANYYYYNQLDESKKTAWDALRAECEKYFSASKDVPRYYEDTDETLGYTDYVTFSQPLTQEELNEFWCMFVYENPQYYFLKNTYMCVKATETTYNKLALVIYDDFWNGTDRAVATTQVKQQLTTWQTEIDACTTDIAKLQKMQDLICAKVTYNDDAAAGTVDEDVSFSQSPYSVLCGDTTVCAGYADTFYMLCNASGIDAISVTSSNHQWNKVRINDSWYNFDVTWDDDYMEDWGYPVYRYYGRSDALYDTDIGSGSASNIAAHQEEDFWNTYLPRCTLDSSPDSTFKNPGTFASISAQTATPEIVVSYVAGEPQITLNCATEDAVIYYTMDKTNPSVAKSKSYKYSDSFASELDIQIKAVAVCDAHLDSAVASKLVELEAYPITYVLDGGVNHEDNPSTYDLRDAVVLEAPAKAGYTFAGWYSDEECTQETTGIAAGSTGARTFYAKWTPISYNITFDGNGATAGSMSDQNGCEYDTAYTLVAGNYEKTGYIFAGWNTEADGTGEKYEDKASVSNLTVADRATVTLYAQWEPITYDIAYEGNGATEGSMGVSICKYDTSQELLTNKYKKTGYTFRAWNTEADGSGKEYADEEEIKNLTETDGKNIVLYAQWKENTYSIAFDGNGATAGSMASENDCIYNVTYKLETSEYERTGYTFAGWNTEADGTGLPYNDEATVKNLTEEDGAIVTLYAQWDPIIYDIVYDGNGASEGSVPAQEGCEYDESYELASNNFVKTGYVFDGWNVEKDGSGTAYEEFESVQNLTATGDDMVTLYAQWCPISYWIVYESGGATAGSMEDGECAYDETYFLDENKYEKSGYVFDSWNTEIDGSGTGYAEGAAVKNLTDVEGVEIVLYAQWKQISYTIAFDGNGATDGEMESLSDCMYEDSYFLTENAYERTGYIFEYWNTEADGTGQDYYDQEPVYGLTGEDKATVTLYAQWRPIKYLIEYDGNGATDGMMGVSGNCAYDESCELIENNYSKTGYAFVGWNTEADGSGTVYTDKASVKNLAETEDEIVTLYAQWTPITYSVAFDGNGATSGNMAEQSGLEYEKAYALAAAEYKKTGYRFVEWNTEESGYGTSYEGGALVENLTEENGAVITLYAQWEPIVYAIAFDGNKATAGEMSGLTDCEYDDDYVLTRNVYERTGYTFDGWNTQADGSGDAYEDKEAVRNLTDKDDETVVLYAQWKPNKYTITFDGNGAESGAVKNMAGCAYDTTYTLNTNAYAKKSYAFVGWNTKADGSGTGYKDGDSVKNLSEADGATVTLYAQWAMVTYHITFDGNGATSGFMNAVNDCEYNVSYKLAENNFAKAGYKFSGWNTEADGTGEAFADQASVQNLTNEDNATVTLYAQWSPIVYKIAYDGNGATGGSMSVQSCNYDASCALSATGYKKAGYTFKNWNTKADGTGKSYADKASVKNLAATDGAVITLYAQWTANMYTIKFDGNKATKGSMSAQTMLLYGKSYALSSNKFAKKGYKFKGWNTQKNGKGISYKNRASVQNLTSVNGDVITLYAQWKANKYHVKFNGNGATSGSVKKLKNRSYGKKYKLPANKFKKTGYKFVGWNTKKNGKGKMYKNKAKIKNLTSKNGKTVTLYAQWKKIK